MKKPNLNTIIADNLNKTAHIPSKGMSGLPNKKATVPFVSGQGYKNGLPPAGSHYRIPSDTLYNPTPYRIKATPNNGPSQWLEAYDTSGTQFPGADYVDEQHFQNGGTYISDRAKATQFGQYAEGGSSWMLTNPNRISTFFPRMANGGGLLSRTVTCSNCGHSWKAVDGGEDVMTCHKCGGMIKMQNGGGIKPPIYLENINDPRISNYRDSLSLYKASADTKKLLTENNNVPVSQLMQRFNNIQNSTKNVLPNAKPVRTEYLENNREVNWFKKPVQPYIYKKPDPVLKPRNRVDQELIKTTRTGAPQLAQGPNVQVQQRPVQNLPYQVDWRMNNEDRTNYFVNEEEGSKFLKELNPVTGLPEYRNRGNYNASGRYTAADKLRGFEEGGDISIPDLNEYQIGGWLDEYQVGGATKPGKVTTQPPTGIVNTFLNNVSKVKQLFSSDNNKKVQAQPVVKKVVVQTPRGPVMKEVVVDDRNWVEKLYQPEEGHIHKFQLPEDVYNTYQTNSSKNKGKKFGVISKQNTRAYFFDNDGKLAIQDEVGLGKDRGEQQPIFYQVMTTPSGEYIMNRPNVAAPAADEFKKGYDADNFFYMDNVDPNKKLKDPAGRKLGARQAMHGIPKHLLNQRLPLFGNNNVDDNYMSAGCINCKKPFLNNPYFTDWKSGSVYVTPRLSPLPANNKTKKMGGEPSYEDGGWLSQYANKKQLNKYIKGKAHTLPVQRTGGWLDSHL